MVSPLGFEEDSASTDPHSWIARHGFTLLTPSLICQQSLPCVLDTVPVLLWSVPWMLQCVWVGGLSLLARYSSSWVNCHVDVSPCCFQESCHVACSLVLRLKTLSGPKDCGMSSKCCSQAIKWCYVLGWNHWLVWNLKLLMWYNQESARWSPDPGGIVTWENVAWERGYIWCECMSGLQ